MKNTINVMVNETSTINHHLPKIGTLYLTHTIYENTSESLYAHQVPVMFVLL